MTGRTGEKCQVSGIYRCNTHPTNTIPLAKGIPSHLARAESATERPGN